MGDVAEQRWPELPDGLELTRTTAAFSSETVPKGLLRGHQVAPGVWGNIVVREGSLGFAFEDDLETVRSLTVDDTQAIPPQLPHRVILTGPATFVVEFYRAD
ncbi:MAG: DUF1971 domain-containing protein [Acidimicrobiia bacterium]|nr:DUF1971 domain-containing protein [Acidimicrobiia bacterium]NNC43486.1 DUF1971 domain-containing protein [Acidimicrobiia bacterium]NNL27391.1 DUF1971 domain-containing protein [Acidimicrobiia bacterium]